MAEITGHIGRRLREIRTWRDLSQKELADHAGISRSYLSMIEAGQRPIERRATIEALASALQVAPSDLVGAPLSQMISDPDVSAAHGTVAEIEAVLTDIAFGDEAVQPRPWPEVAPDLRLLNEKHRPATDYAAQGAMVPGLIRELHALTDDPTAPRVDVLEGLMVCYSVAGTISYVLGVHGLPALASWHARRIAEELDDPAWLAFATRQRAHAINGSNRARMYSVAIKGAEDLQPHMADARAREMYGALHLQASMAATVQGRTDVALHHLNEAADVAGSLEEPAAPTTGFGGLCFSADNVRLWRMAISIERGEGGRASEIARGIDAERLPHRDRRSTYWSDLGIGMASERGKADRAIMALRRAEDVAPVWIRTRPLVRDTVTDLLPRARGETARREVRGMAYRMGIAG
jgi:transcriptional regulator with XRE-family HTH domain